MIILRKMEEKDLPFLLEVRNDDSTRKWLENDSVFTLEQCREWFKNLKDQWYIVEFAHNNVPIGYVRTSDETDDNICIGCDIHPKYRRKGYATEALQATIKKYKAKQIYLWVFNDNTVATKLYLKLGFEFDGHGKMIRNKCYFPMKLKKIANSK